MHGELFEDEEGQTVFPRDCSVSLLEALAAIPVATAVSLMEEQRATGARAFALPRGVIATYDTGSNKPQFGGATYDVGRNRGVLALDDGFYEDVIKARDGCKRTVSVRVVGQLHMCWLDGKTISDSLFSTITGRSWEEFVRHHITGGDEYVAPRKVEDVRELGEYMSQVGMFYLDTGEEVPNVFAYDLDEGYCWQHVVGADGIPEMDGPNIKCRRVSGNFTVRRKS